MAIERVESRSSILGRLSNSVQEGIIRITIMIGRPGMTDVFCQKFERPEGQRSAYVKKAHRVAFDYAARRSDIEAMD